MSIHPFHTLTIFYLFSNSFHSSLFLLFSFFFFNDTATTEIYTLSLHDALPISIRRPRSTPPPVSNCGSTSMSPRTRIDRKSTRLNSSHVEISYAVFCLKKKKKKKQQQKIKQKTKTTKGKIVNYANSTQRTLI